MSTSVHPTALVDPSAEVCAGATVGPWAIVGPQVQVGPGSQVAAHAVLERNVRLGARCRVGVGSVLGGDPQDVKFAGENTWVEVGPETVVREYSTINRGTQQSGTTSIGAGCFIMSYVHVAHDCHLADGVVVANGVQMAGHVEIGERAMISGLTPIHQFVRVGRLAIVGGGSRVNQDVPPFTKAVGNPLKLYGLNTVGLQRAGVPGEVRLALKRAYRLVFNSGLNLGDGIARAREEVQGVDEVIEFLDFIEQSPRGVEV